MILDMIIGYQSYDTVCPDNVKWTYLKEPPLILGARVYLFDLQHLTHNVTAAFSCKCVLAEDNYEEKAFEKIYINHTKLDNDLKLVQY